MRLQATAIQILKLYQARGTLQNADVAQAIGKSTKTAQTYTQSYEEAQIVLDMRRAGHDIDLAVINTALELCGDLDHVPFSLADALEAA